MDYATRTMQETPDEPFKYLNPYKIKTNKLGSALKMRIYSEF